MTIVKVYIPQDRQIQIHQSHVKSCPNFPTGFYWYSSQRRGPGQPQKWSSGENIHKQRVASRQQVVSKERATRKQATNRQEVASQKYNLRSRVQKS